MLTIPPEITRINQKLVDEFGIDSSTGQPIWRVVWSDDQYEKRLMPTTDGGLTLLFPEVREVPKYRQWIPHKWVLEQLVVVPDMNIKELPTVKLSYEPMFPFEDRLGNATQPTFHAAKFIVDTVYAAKGKGSLNKYTDPEATQEGALAAKEARLDELVESIFGDETDVSDHLARQTGVVISDDKFRVKEN